MAKRQGTKANARQAKIAAIQAEEAQRRRRVFLSVGAVGAVLLAVAGLLVAKAVTSGESSAAVPVGGSASSAVTQAVSNVSPKVFDQVGTGALQTPPSPIRGKHTLTQGGKPRVLYVGAEYCPYCAAERWAVVAALSRFGSFSNLGQTTSSAQDVYPSTPTLSFHGADYSSPHLAFTGYEIQSNQLQGSSYAPLDRPSPADEKTFTTFDAPPYVSAQAAGSIPFVDIGGRYVISGASYNPGVLQGNTREQIARALSDPSSDIAQSVDGTANVISAAVCQLTDDQPTKVCASAGVKAAASSLPRS